ncbi:tyrosine-type recombinase/integrase [candidate division TA06 bacterium]|nr:tyrosine-type recombinase/integrase [candidate division TA06 bacterium]
MTASIPVGKIDIHDSIHKYEVALRTLAKDKYIIPENKKLILAFLRDCEAGKTVKNRSKKKLCPSRCNRLLDMLKLFSHLMNKRFDKITQDEFETFVLAFDKDKYRKRDGRKYSDSTKVYYKKGFRKYGNWMKGKGLSNLDYSFMETIDPVKEVPALTREEIDRMVNKAALIRDRALVMLLFDSGARIEEFLNIRLKHLIKRDNYYQVRIEFSKTKPRTVSLPMCTKILEEWLLEHPEKNNPEAQLFPISYDGVRMVIKRLARKVLKKGVHVHQLRHSSATYYCHKLSSYQLCYRYGWSMSSDQPARYIDREGINEEETAELVATDEVLKIKKENQEIKETMTRLKDENSSIWKLIDKLNITSKITQEVIENHPEVKKEIIKVMKKMISKSDMPLNISFKTD